MDQLVERARRRDSEAFTMLVAGRYPAMLRIATAILGQEADGRDAAQDALALIWRQLPALRDPARFDAWADRILVNTCRLALRRRRRVAAREISLTTTDAGPGSARSGRSVEEDVVNHTVLERAFERLGADDRALLVLHHLEHRPLADLAERIGIPVGTAKSRLYAARRALERQLERER